MGNTIKEWCIAIPAGVVLTAYSILINTYVFMCIWEWFVSIPFGISLITYKTALCIRVVIGYVTDNGWTHIPENASGSYLRHTVLSPIVTLCICYLIQYYYING